MLNLLETGAAAPTVIPSPKSCDSRQPGMSSSSETSRSETTTPRNATKKVYIKRAGISERKKRSQAKKAELEDEEETGVILIENSDKKEEKAETFPVISRVSNYKSSNCKSNFLAILPWPSSKSYSHVPLSYVSHDDTVVAPSTTRVDSSSAVKLEREDNRHRGQEHKHADDNGKQGNKKKDDRKKVVNKMQEEEESLLLLNNNNEEYKRSDWLDSGDKQQDQRQNAGRGGVGDDGSSDMKHGGHGGGSSRVPLMKSSSSGSVNQNRLGTAAGQEGCGLTVDRPLNLSFASMAVEVVLKDNQVSACKRIKSGFTRFTKTIKILKEASGVVQGGKLTVLMGMSGSGKSTLMNAVSGRLKSKKHCHVAGTLMLNGQVVRSKVVQRLSGFVRQEDVLLGTLTPRECITFSSFMRLPSTVSLSEKKKRAEAIIVQLDLQKCADTICGTVLQRGISGGERKRVSIGVELVTNPTLLFVDEPSSGLDSSTALTILRVLKKLVLQGRTVMCTLHSPSPKMFQLFDCLMLLSKGRMCYSGNASQVTKYLSQFGLRCSPQENPADFCLEVLSTQDEQGKERVKRLASSHQSSSPLLSLEQEDNPDFQAMIEANKPKLSYGFQLRHLTKRAITSTWRHPMNTVARIAENLLLGLFVGMLYWSIGRTQVSMNERIGFLFFSICVNSLLSLVTSVVLFSEERPVYLHEKRQKMYRTSVYFIAKTAVELPYQILVPTIFGAIPYYMIGLKASFAVFMQFSLSLILLGQAAESLGLLLGVLVPHPAAALMLCPLVMIPFMLVTGFFLNLESIPSYLVWLKVLSPHKYVFSSLMGTQFTDLSLTCTDDELIVTPGLRGNNEYCPILRGEQVLKVFNISDVTYWENTLYVLLLVVLFRVMAFCAMKWVTRKER